MEIQTNEPLAPHTTLQIGGVAAHYVKVTTETELQEAIAWARERSLSVKVLGGGSNLLVSDEAQAGLVIHLAITGTAYEVLDGEVAVTVLAGEWFDDVVAETVAQGYWGLENLSGIPGSFGGGVVQNINAYGVTIGNLITEVTAVHRTTGVIKKFAIDVCDFVYRNSWFKSDSIGREYIVVSATLKLSTEPMVETTYKSATQSMRERLEAKGIVEPTSQNVRDAILEVREKVGMLAGMYQSAGSFFKNPIITTTQFTHVKQVVAEQFGDKDAQFTPWYWPVADDQVKVSAAFLLECTPYNKTMFKDQTHNGAVGISPVHSLSLVNIGNATAADVHSFATLISEKVFTLFAVTLEPEVSVW